MRDGATYRAARKARAKAAGLLWRALPRLGIVTDWKGSEKIGQFQMEYEPGRRYSSDRPVLVVVP